MLSSAYACPAVRTGARPGRAFRVPAGSALVVTDLLGAATIELSSDDGKTRAIVIGPEHFTAGLVFRRRSHVNVRAVSGETTVTVLGYLVDDR